MGEARRADGREAARSQRRGLRRRSWMRLGRTTSSSSVRWLAHSFFVRPLILDTRRDRSGHHEEGRPPECRFNPRGHRCHVRRRIAECVDCVPSSSVPLLTLSSCSWYATNDLFSFPLWLTFSRSQSWSSAMADRSSSSRRTRRQSHTARTRLVTYSGSSCLVSCVLSAL